MSTMEGVGLERKWREALLVSANTHRKVLTKGREREREGERETGN